MQSIVDSVDLKQLGRLFREQRQRQQVSQAEAARQVGARQSQISGFENGRAVLAQDKIRRLAAFLEIDLDSSALPQATPSQAIVVAYCSALECPGNLPFFIEGRGHVKPQFVRVAAEAGQRCRLCGDPLVSACVHCGAPVQTGLCCSACGNTFVEADEALFDGEPTEAVRRCDAVRAQKQELVSFGPTGRSGGSG